jgi:tight adherence protein C
MGILLALLFAVIAFCGYLLFDAVMIDKKRQESLRARISPDGQVSDVTMDEATGHLTRDPSPRGLMILSWMRRLGVQVDATLPKLEEQLAQAGINSADAPAYYLFFERIVSVIICSIMLLLALAHGQENRIMFYVLVAIVIGVAIFGPKLYLKNKAEHRRIALLRAFPDTLDLLLICVEAGLALDAALNRICGELGRAYPEMAEELNRTRLELSLLNDRIKALSNLAERTDMPAFRSLVSSLVQSERFGTSLTDTLRVLADDFRLQRMADAEARAARIPVLMTIPLMLLLMPAFMLIILGPAIVNISHAIHHH